MRLTLVVEPPPHTHTQLERLDVFVHRLIDSGDEPTSTIRKPVTTLISLVLVVFTVVIKLGNFIK